jgi:ABC-type microcin C transport system duplicated ATPase subunit YejF
MALLDVNGLKVYFHTRNGVVKAVDDVSLSVDAGKTLAIVGESGSGKSVLCYSLLDLLPKPPARIEGGVALFDGQDLLTCSKQQMRGYRGNDIAVIFHHRDARYGRQQARRRAIELLDEVGIAGAEARFDAYPHEFSGGMRQRVMIAMAMINEPRLLICDEPTTALDVTIQAQILRLIKNLQHTHNVAVIFISHDLGVVAGLADQILVMCAGKAMETGDAEQVFYRPESGYTKKLLAAIPEGAKSATGHARPEVPLLKIEHLKTWFGGHSAKDTIKAVDGVSFEIRQGEILGLVGESGSGKSTLGRSILRLAPVTAGQVSYAGTELTALSARQLVPWRRKMQMIFQDPYASLNPRMTVFETLAEPLLYHELADRRSVAQQVEKLMDEVGLARANFRVVSDSVSRSAAPLRRNRSLSSPMNRHPRWMSRSRHRYWS